jgi:hypothetical protein
MRRREFISLYRAAVAWPLHKAELVQAPGELADLARGMAAGLLA